MPGQPLRHPFDFPLLLALGEFPTTNAELVHMSPSLKMTVRIYSSTMYDCSVSKVPLRSLRTIYS